MKFKVILKSGFIIDRYGDGYTIVGNHSEKQPIEGDHGVSRHEDQHFFVFFGYRRGKKENLYPLDYIPVSSVESIIKVGDSTDEVSVLKQVANRLNIDIRPYEGKLEKLSQATYSTYLTNENEQIIGLHLIDAGLRSIPTEIFEFKELIVLSLKYNSIRELSPKCSDFLKLKEFDLSENKLEQFPAMLSQVVGLEILSLAENRIKTIPKEIQYFTMLKVLDLGFNKVKELPNEVGSLKNLLKLVLRMNQLTKLPDLSNLQTLLYLDIGYNEFHFVPEKLFRLKTLQTLNLSSNRLREFPKDIFGLNMKTQWVDDSNHQPCTGMNLFGNPVQTPPLEVVHQGKEAILKYFLGGPS